MALEDVTSGKVVKHGINGYSNHALPAYIMAVASVEAFINEVFLSQVYRMTIRESPLMNLPKDWTEKVELGVKLILVPQLLFGESFPRDAQPYQDMAMLIKIRNALVHYKMGSTPPKYIKPLEQRGIMLTSFGTKQGIHTAWIHKLSCSEGIRWAHNTACETVKALITFIPENSKEKFGIELSSTNFKPIAESYAVNWLKSRGIEADDSQ